MPDVQHKRGSRADLNTLAAANGLLLGQIYVITDEDRLAVATGVGSYQAAEKEGGGGGGTALELYAENPSSPTAPSATGTNAVAIGTNASAAGSGATALTKSRASGADSFAAAIANNTATYGATGANSVAIGDRARATGANDAISIGYFSRATGVNQSVTFGAYCQSTASYAFSAGYDSKANASSSVAIGSYASSDIEGKYAFSGDRFSSHGDAQTGTFVLLSDTTDATPEALTTNNGTAGTTNQIILPNNSAFAFHGTIVARQQASGGTACAAWKVEGLIRREGSAGTTVLVNSATTVLDNTPAWGMTLSADTTNGGLKIEVTGAAATNIRWVSTINTSEVTY